MMTQEPCEVCGDPAPDDERYCPDCTETEPDDPDPREWSYYVDEG